MPTKTAHRHAAARKVAPRPGKKPLRAAARTSPVRPTMVHKSQVAFFELEIRIAVAPQRVWTAITQEINQWWLADFRCAPHSKEIKMEPWPGGRLYEEAPEGGGLLWFNVAAITPPESLHLAGYIIPPYGGPATTLLYLSLTKTPSGTLLKVHNSVLGYVSKTQLNQTVEGWRQLFAEGLKPFVEDAG